MPMSSTMDLVLWGRSWYSSHDESCSMSRSNLERCSYHEVNVPYFRCRLSSREGRTQSRLVSLKQQEVSVQLSYHPYNWSAHGSPKTESAPRMANMRRLVWEIVTDHPDFLLIPDIPVQFLTPSHMQSKFVSSRVAEPTSLHSAWF
jgi:hypothetical protein